MSAIHMRTLVCFVGLKDDVAQTHIKKTVDAKQRKELFKSVGPYRKALCARYDLLMRRQLNNLNTVCG